MSKVPQIYFINPSFTKPFGTHTLYQGVGPTPAISKTVAPTNFKFCRVLETSFNVLEMLKLFTYFLLGYHTNSSKEKCFIGKIARFQPKNTNIQIATKFTILKITL